MAEPRPVTVKGVCLDGAGRVLVCRNARGEWELPGGRPEAGERLEQCLAREVREETGLEVAVRERVAAYPFEVVPDRWVHVIAFGCALLGTAGVARWLGRRVAGFVLAHGTFMTSHARAPGGAGPLLLHCAVVGGGAGVSRRPAGSADRAAT